MPARLRPQLPTGHGELLTRPHLEEWGVLLAQNVDLAAGWDFEVAGRPVVELRRVARQEALASGLAYSGRLGVSLKTVDHAVPIVATGHQPELYHTGVWVKDFLLQRVSEEVGCNALDVVVDSDGFDTLAITAPCLLPEVRRCRQYLAIGTADTCYACAPVPGEREIAEFCHVGDEMLGTLRAPAIRHHFAEFCEALTSARHDAENLADLVTMARRRYEASAGTDYLELPVTRMVTGESFMTFLEDIVTAAPRFAAAYNAELQDYRAISKTRSSAQPFPDLETNGDRVELPFWALADSRRRTLWVKCGREGCELYAEDAMLASGASAREALVALRDRGALVAPKALALTLFVRLFCCDLFIHGVGGGRYDRVTDGVCRRYYGVEPPSYVVASLTMYLPLGAHIITEAEVSAAKERLNRIQHNPNEVLGEADFDSAEERSRAVELAKAKTGLVSRISLPDADKKSLGMEIRRVNKELSDLLAPLREHWEAELRSLESQLAASEVFSDRGYPFCFWSPHEVADKVR